MEKLIKKLTQFYPDTKFIESTRDNHKVLLYDNEDLEWNDEFISKVIELAEENLKDEDLINFTFLYDYLDEISNNTADEIFGVNYIQSSIDIEEIIQKKIEILGLLEVNIKVNNEKLSKLVEAVTFKEYDSKNLVIASQF